MSSINAPANRGARDSERRRLTRLHGRWRRWGRQPLGSAGWETLIEEHFGTLVILIGFGFSIAFTPFDLGVWLSRLEPYDLGIWALETDPRIEAFFQSLHAAWLIGALGALFVVNGWIADRLLSRWDPSPRAPLRVRALRSLIGGLPTVGLSVLPLWLAWRRHARAGAKPDPISPAAPAGKEPSVLCLRGLLDRTARILTSAERLGVLFLLNCVVVFAAGNHLAWPQEPSPRRTAMVLTLCLALHLLAWLNMAFWLGTLARRFSPTYSLGSRWWLHSLLWLFPVPYLAALGALLLLSRQGRSGPTRTLTEMLYETSHDLRGIRSWTRLEATLRADWTPAPWWRRWRRRPQSLETPRARPKAEEEVLRLCRIKALALGFEAAYLTFLAVAAARELGLEALFQAALAGVALIACAVAVLGLFWRLWHFFVFWARAGEAVRDPPREAAVSCLVASQLALVGGCLVGAHLAAADVRSLGAVLLLIGLIGLTLQAGPIFLRLVVSAPLPVARDVHREAPWLALFTAFLVCGMSMGKGESVGPIYAALVLFAAALSPLWGAIAGGLCLPWLLRPFKLRDLLIGPLPGKQRRLLLGLVVTVLMPLGGLVSPWWILVRRRDWGRLEADG